MADFQHPRPWKEFPTTPGFWWRANSYDLFSSPTIQERFSPIIVLGPFPIQPDSSFYDPARFGVEQMALHTPLIRFQKIKPHDLTRPFKSCGTIDHFGYFWINNGSGNIDMIRVSLMNGGSSSFGAAILGKEDIVVNIFGSRSQHASTVNDLQYLKNLIHSNKTIQPVLPFDPLF